jgi:hypothetical protein
MYFKNCSQKFGILDSIFSALINIEIIFYINWGLINIENILYINFDNEILITQPR